MTIHVEIDEPIEPTLAAIRAAGRAAGLCVKPKTPLSALEPYRQLLDIVMVMTVEPGFGGQAFMADVAKAKLLQAREYLSHKLHGGEVHVDGGVNRDTAELVGGLGVDILVVGSALWLKGRDMAPRDPAHPRARRRGLPVHAEQRRAADPARPDGHVRLAAPAPGARSCATEVEAAGIPVLLFRSREDPADMDDEVRRWDVLIPASAEAAAKERFGDARRSRAGRGLTSTRRLRLTCGRSSSASAAPSVRVGDETRRLDRPGPAGLPRRRPRRRRRDRGVARPARSRSCGSSRDEEGRTNRSILDVGGAALVVSQFTLYADTSRGRRPGFTDAADPRSRTASTRRSRRRSARPGSRTCRRARSAPRWRSSSSTTARSRSGSTRTAERSFSPARSPGRSVVPASRRCRAANSEAGRGRGTVETSIGPNSRESAEAARWSPMTNRAPSGTSQLVAPPIEGSVGSGDAAPLEEVRLVQLGAVDDDEAVLEIDPVAREADDPLDERRTLVGSPRGRWLEHDDVAPLVLRPSGRELVDEDVLVREERGHHRALLDAEGLGDEGVDDEEDQDGQDEGLDDLEETAERQAPLRR